MPKHALVVEGSAGGQCRLINELYPTEPNTANVFSVGSNVYAYTYKLAAASTRTLDVDCGTNIYCAYVSGDVGGGQAYFATVDTRISDWSATYPGITVIYPRDSGYNYLGGFVNFNHGIVKFGGKHEFYPFFAHNFADSFDRADNSATVGGSGWSVHNRESSHVAAAWAISGNQAVCTAMPVYGGGANEAMLLHDASSGDFTMTITLGAFVDGANEGASISAFRVGVDDDDGAEAMGYWLLRNDLLIRVRSNEGGSRILSLAETFVAGDIAKIVAVGDNIKVYRNSTQVIEITDSYNMTKTWHGLASYMPSYDHFKFDGVTIQS